MNRLRAVKRVFLALFFFIIALFSVAVGFIGLFFSSPPSSSEKSAVSSAVSSDDQSSSTSSETDQPTTRSTANQPFVTSSNVLNSDFDPKIAPEKDKSPFLPERSLAFSTSALSNPIIDPDPIEDPIEDPIDIQPSSDQRSPETVASDAAKKERLIEDLQQLSEEIEEDLPGDLNLTQTTAYPDIGPSVSGPVRQENTQPYHTDSTEMAIGELFKRKPGYRTDDFDKARHEFKIATTNSEQECSRWGRKKWWQWNAPCIGWRTVTRVERRNDWHRMPVISRRWEVGTDFAVFVEEDKYERLNLKLYSNFKEWKRWALAGKVRQRFWRNVPLLRLVDEITFEASQNSEEEIVEWIESRLSPDVEFPDWSLHSPNSKLLYISHGLRNNGLTIQTKDYDSGVAWQIVASKNQGDIPFFIHIYGRGEGDTRRFVVRKGTAGGKVMLNIELGGLDLDEVIDRLTEMVSFYNQPANDFELLVNHLDSHEIQSQGLHVTYLPSDFIRLVRFDSNKRLVIWRDPVTGDVLIDVQILGADCEQVVDCEQDADFDELVDIRIPFGAISNSEEPEALLETYSDLFKRILSVNTPPLEDGEENPEWISLFELLSVFFGEGMLTEIAHGDDPDPRYIGSYFHLVNTEEGTDKRMEFWINFLRVARRESASDTTKKLLIFFRTLLEDPDRIEEILSISEFSDSTKRYESIVETVNALFSDAIEGSGFDLKSKKIIEDCKIATDTYCYAFVIQLLDSFRINDFLLFFVRFIKLFFYEIREHGPSNLGSIDPNTASLDFDVVSRIFAPENAERNILTAKKLLKKVAEAMVIADENGEKTNLLNMVFDTITGVLANFFGKGTFNKRWRASVDELVDSKREEILDFLGKIPKSFQILDDLRSMFGPSNDDDSKRDNLANMIEEQTSGAISGRLAKLAALTILLATRTGSDLPEDADPVSATAEDDSELTADLETILNSEGARFFSSLDDYNLNEFSWSSTELDRGIKLREYLKNRPAEKRNILVFSWTNSEERAFTTAIRIGEAGPEVIFHFEGASPRTIDRLNSLISSQIAAPSVT